MSPLSVNLCVCAGRLENAEPTHTHTHSTLYTALLLPAPTAQGRASTPYSTLSGRYSNRNKQGGREGGRWGGGQQQRYCEDLRSVFR